MELLVVLLLIAGAVSFALAAFRPQTTRISLVALGLLFWILVPLMQAFVRLS